MPAVWSIGEDGKDDGGSFTLRSRPHVDDDGDPDPSSMIDMTVALTRPPRVVQVAE